MSTIAEEKHEEKKKKHYHGLQDTIPIDTLAKVSVLSKEAPPENYSGFIRLGSKFYISPPPFVLPIPETLSCHSACPGRGQHSAGY